MTWNQARPSWTRPLVIHTGRSDDASVKSPLGVVVFQVPAERIAQVVHFEFGPIEVLLVVSAGRLVHERGYRCVVIPMTRPDGIGFAGFAEFSSAYWRTVSSKRYRVRPLLSSATVSDLSTSKVSWSKT